ncbi:MAG TPA: alanine--tRNA ligase [Candidatus Woesebacteria bacterium]|nr:alanine--tRNA ligase [Candidatus Woesebacteria bacterium]
MNVREIRKKFIDFYKARGHIEIPSVSLVPENDPSTLFTSAGMQPMMLYLLGEKHPLGKRIVDSQKCFRSQDIEEVGDNRHTTFFEMLGNWSLGDYFKKEQLEFIFTFLTDKNEGIGLDPNRIHVSVFKGDENQKLMPDTETIDLWIKLFGKYNIKAGIGNHIFTYPSNKNWWSRSGSPDKMPAGEPGGPDSEIFYDFGPELKLHENSKWKDQPCHINCDCGRFLEIGNSVFMQYLKQSDGSLKDLPQKNIDFGGGLTRLEAVSKNNPDMFNISTLSPLIKEIEKISQKSYSDLDNKAPMRIIADHITASVFLINDGVVPSNKAQGYVLRRLIRRAIRQGKIINIENDLIVKIAKLVINDENYTDKYPELIQNQNNILDILTTEENKFRKTLNNGLREINKLITRNKTVSGKEAFTLYETFGFPVEMIQEELAKNNLTLNIDDFDQAKLDHQKLSQTLSAGKFKSGLADNSEIITKFHTVAHLLHAALRKVLGSHVQQAGSNITSERIRFDFTNPEKLTEDQLKQVTDLVNDQIKLKLPVTVENMPFTEATKKGALAFFGNKYPENVTVYTIGSKENYFSKEVCTGPHVANLSVLGHFEIFKEESAGSGKRRIYAVLK